MNRARRSLLLLALLVGAAISAACNPAAQGRSPDPRATVIDALTATAALEAVHAVVRIDLRDGFGKQYSATIEGDVNVAAREFDLSGKLDPPVFGVQDARIVIADSFVFSNTSGTWSVSGGPDRDPLEFVPTTARVAAMFTAAIADPATMVALQGREACSETTCLRIRTEVPAHVAWRTLSGLTSTAGGPQDSVGPPPASFPGVAIDFWIEQDAPRLRQASSMTQIGGQSLAITIALSRHGIPVVIEPPILR